MKIALLADIHANLPALEVVLDDAELAGAEAIWNLGDIVGYGPFPNEVVRLLRNVGAVSIIGNYDRKVLSFQRNKDKWQRNKNPTKYLSFRWAWENLSAVNKKYLLSLPCTQRLKVGPCRALLTHGSPVSDEEHLLGDTPVERLAFLAEQAEADLIACGHSHVPFVRKVADTVFINPGSVGRHEGSGAKTSYAILEFTNGIPAVEHRLLDYPVERTVQALQNAGLPGQFAEVFLRGKKLDDIIDDNNECSPQPTNSENPADHLQAVLALAEQCHYEREHSHQVTKLALEIFDDLQPLHNLGAESRFFLHCAGLLHDIGWLEGQKAHHKTALILILNSPILKFSDRARRIVGCVARYHRKALPSKKHKVYATLSRSDRQQVCLLGGILRLADGLDRTHLGIVRRVSADISGGTITFNCQTSGPADIEQQAGLKKSNLLQQVLSRKITLRMRRPPMGNAHAND